MTSIFLICAGIAMVLTLVVMGIGVLSMAKDEEFRKKYSNRLMQARVAFQAAAIVFLFLAFAAN